MIRLVLVMVDSRLSDFLAWWPQSTRRKYHNPIILDEYMPITIPHHNPKTPSPTTNVNIAPSGTANIQNPNMFSQRTNFCLPNPRNTPPVVACTASPIMNTHEIGISWETRCATSLSLLIKFPKTSLHGHNMTIKIACVKVLRKNEVCDDRLASVDF
mmetsp:Transcript_56236/g.119578  ORF Transcript_56236/g.119578 Transcript_56236/m.119578 type:complete len:157 (+) Transcript_56236:103-573(+)